MGKLLDDVSVAGERVHRLELQLSEAREILRKRMAAAHDEEISMNRIAKAAGITREGVRYALGRQNTNHTGR